MKKILLIGPFPNPISGVSLANKIVNTILEESDNYKSSILDTSYPYFDEFIGRFSFKKLWFFLKLNLKSLKIFSADIVYMTPGQTFLGVTKYTLFILLSRILKKRIIIHVHGNHIGTCYKELKTFKKKFYYFLLSQFSEGIVLSKSLRNNLIPFLNSENIYELPNFAENYLINNTNEVYNKKLRIVFLSNLMYEKGITVLLDTLKKMEEINISYEAKLAGNIDESLKDKINNKINQLKYTEYIGVVSGIDKKKLLEWSNTFVLPTFYKMEGQPISILEAMATRNIIITTNHAGISDVVTDNKNGFFIEKNDINSMMNAFIKISNDLNLINTISDFNFKYFYKNFTLSNFKKRLLKILNE